jgi:peptide/nickel transport system substrate-binding protein
MRRTWCWLALIVTVTVLTAPTPPTSAQVSDLAAPAAGRDTVVVGNALEPTILNPLLAPGVFSAFDSIIPTLFTIDVERDAAWRPFPQGMEYLPSVADGTWRLDGEKMTLVWKLRPRNWHDGRPVTCADYVFSHRVARDERVEVPGGRRELSKRIASVSCPKGAEGLEIVVLWKERYAYANLVVIGQLARVPRHLVEPFYRANPSTLTAIPYGNDPRSTVGDGPYRLVEWARLNSLTVEGVANHPIFGTPKIKRITWRFMSQDALVASMLSGAIDAISAVSIGLILAVPLERQAKDRVKVLSEPGLIWEHIDFNLDNPLLQDVRVRRAIAHGINRTQIDQQLFQGRELVSHTYLPPKHPGYTDTVQKYPYDPARALLQQAGFSPGPDGIMRNAAGQRLSLEINTTAGNPLREQIEQIIQEQLRRVGIEITILNFPTRVFFGEFTDRRKFKGLSLYAWRISPFGDCNSLYTSSDIPSGANGWRGRNLPGYKNAEMDRVCKSASREVLEPERKKLLNASAQIFSRDLPALPLFFRVQVAAVKAGLQNFTPRGLLSVTWNAPRWYWK